MIIPNLGYVEEPVRVCDGCKPIVAQGGKHFQEVFPFLVFFLFLFSLLFIVQAPAWVPHQNSEPEWHAPPASNPELAPGSSAPPSNYEK